MENNTLWRVINKYFEDNPQYLVAHHLESYNDFFQKDIFDIFKNKNPIQIVSAQDAKTGEYKHKCNLYIGGRTGRRIYFGKPMIHDGADRGAHYMYPNEARLRNMTYGMTVHYDVEVEFIDVLAPGEMPYAIGPEFLNEEEIAKLGEISGGGAIDEFDIDYSQEFQRESKETTKNYKLDGGENIMLELEKAGVEEAKLVGGAKKTGAADAPPDGEKVAKKKHRDKQAELERRQTKLTTAMAAAVKDAQAKSVTGTTQTR